MDRVFSCRPPWENCVPHLRGDGPPFFASVEGVGGVFPTCVGMDRLGERQRNLIQRVPHLRGDGPRL